MASLLDTAALALGAFAGTNIDGLLTLSGQLAASDRSRHGRIGEGQFAATVLIIGLCALGGVGLQSVPHSLLGLLGLVPIGLGIRAVVMLVARRSDDRTVPGGGGFFSSFGVTFAISGDNVAVYLPVLATSSTAAGALTIGIWLVADLLLIALASAVGRHPAIRTQAVRVGPVALAVVYIAVGVVVVLRAGTFG